MNGYLDDALLTLSLIGAPVVFCTLLYYGLKISNRGHHDTHDDERNPAVHTKPMRARASTPGRISR